MLKLKELNWVCIKHFTRMFIIFAKLFTRHIYHYIILTSKFFTVMKNITNNFWTSTSLPMNWQSSLEVELLTPGSHQGCIYEGGDKRDWTPPWVKSLREILLSANFLAVLFSSQPVSYTHLDVYKRQILNRTMDYKCHKARIEG